MNIYIHIGSTKTGSSALQHFLNKNSNILSEHGIAYPDVGIVSDAHHLIAATLHPMAFKMHSNVIPDNIDQKLEFFYSRVEQFLTAARNVRTHSAILSSEYLWGEFQPEFYAHWREAFKDCNLHLYAILRRPDQWVQSSYLQALKSGEGRAYADWYRQFKSSPTSGTDYYQVIKRWADNLGIETVYIRTYENLVSNNSLFNDLLKTINPHANFFDKLTYSSRLVNPSPTQEMAELLLSINSSNIQVDHKKTLRKLILMNLKKRDIGELLEILPLGERNAVALAYKGVIGNIMREYIGSDQKRQFFKSWLA
ncbi:hypothetical protein [Nitrosomonas sp. Is37]|uniref:hypothetical protein n=1 Tax=Nitrosomonas sp. Is37 TaxID=3080535 RepID=UPI00294B9530|nr:hypothetical protein [Nitrosomonas sp. Is37]MDV6344299.1 hypothetical protein [Nitrosomonas sp. Is37]